MSGTKRKAHVPFSLVNMSLNFETVVAIAKNWTTYACYLMNGTKSEQQLQLRLANADLIGAVCTITLIEGNKNPCDVDPYLSENILNYIVSGVLCGETSDCFYIAIPARKVSEGSRKQSRNKRRKVVSLRKKNHMNRTHTESFVTNPSRLETILEGSSSSLNTTTTSELNSESKFVPNQYGRVLKYVVQRYLKLKTRLFIQLPVAKDIRVDQYIKSLLEDERSLGNKSQQKVLVIYGYLRRRMNHH